MTMLFRLLTEADLHAALELVAQEIKIDIAPQSLIEIWRSWLANGSMHGGVVEDPTLPAPARIQFIGMSVFLQEAFIAKLVQHPKAQASAFIYQQVLNGNSPVLTRREIAVGNHETNGLSLMVLHCFLREPDITRPQEQVVVKAAKGLFDWLFTGFQLNSISFQVYGASQRDYVLANGLNLLAQEQVSYSTQGAACFLSSTRDQSRFGSAVSYYFTRHLPRFGFTAAEQAVLLRAVFNESDEDIASNLQIAPDTVSKHWRSMFKRVERCDTEFFPSSGKAQSGSRGPEKRRLLLHYVRQHFEEIRPYVS
jgi:DNA-binding CsgD family transcriptional regulator